MDKINSNCGIEMERVVIAMVETKAGEQWGRTGLLTPSGMAQSEGHLEEGPHPSSVQMSSRWTTELEAES